MNSLLQSLALPLIELKDKKRLYNQKLILIYNNIIDISSYEAWFNTFYSNFKDKVIHIKHEDDKSYVIFDLKAPYYKKPSESMFDWQGNRPEIRVIKDQTIFNTLINDNTSLVLYTPTSSSNSSSFSSSSSVNSNVEIVEMSDETNTQITIPKNDIVIKNFAVFIQLANQGLFYPKGYKLRFEKWPNNEIFDNRTRRFYGKPLGKDTTDLVSCMNILDRLEEMKILDSTYVENKMKIIKENNLTSIINVLNSLPSTNGNIIININNGNITNNNNNGTINNQLNTSNNDNTSNKETTQSSPQIDYIDPVMKDNEVDIEELDKTIESYCIELMKDPIFKQPLTSDVVKKSKISFFGNFIVKDKLELQFPKFDQYHGSKKYIEHCIGLVTRSQYKSALDLYDKKQREFMNLYQIGDVSQVDFIRMINLELWFSLVIDDIPNTYDIELKDWYNKHLSKLRNNHTIYCCNHLCKYFKRIRVLKPIRNLLKEYLIALNFQERQFNEL